MNISKHILSLFPIVCLSLFAAVASADTLVNLDFETAGQYTNNFRRLNGNATVVQTNGSVAVAKGTADANNSTGLVPVYDTTPASGAVKSVFTVTPGTILTVSFDVRFATANSSFGIYLANPSTENSTTALLALFNVDASGQNDQIRFSRNGNPGNLAGAGTLVNGTFANNADVGVGVGEEFHTITLAYSINDSSRPVLAMTVGNTTSTVVFNDVFALANVEIALRLSPQGPVGQSDLWFDNFTVSTTTVGNVAATVVGQPGDVWVYEGTSVAIDTASFAGTPPLFYQWNFEGAPIEGETNAAINLANVTPSMAGNYSVTVWNGYGTNTSSNALVTVIPQYNTARMTNIWDLLPGDRFYITSTSGGQRGLAWNPVSSNLLVVSHVPSNNIVILDPVMGAEKGFMNLDGVPAGAAGVNVIGVADDGAVYAANVTTDASSPSTPFILSRWDSDDTNVEPLQLLAGDPGYYATGTGGNGLRWGDNMTVRGAGADTQILMGPGSSTNVCFLVTEDGYSYMPMIIPITGVTSGFAAWGVAFGPGTNTFWAKGSGKPLYLVQFDLESQSGFVLQTYTNVPGTWKLISTDSSKRWLAGIMRVGHNLADNMQLYDMSDLTNGLVLADQELYTTAVLNGILSGIGSGTTAFGRDYLFALDEANGIKAFQIVGGLAPFAVTLTMLDAGQIRLSWPSEVGHAYRIQSRSNLGEGEWSNVGDPITAAGSTAAWTNSITGSTQFYRVDGQ